MAITNISLNQASWDILEYYRANVLDSQSIDVRQIKYWVNSVRAKLLKQKFDKSLFDGIDEHYVQNLSYNTTGTPLIELELVDSSFYSSIPSDRYLVRTKVSLPATIERS